MNKVIAIQRIKECKFGDECKNEDCKFLHEHQRYGEIVGYNIVDRNKVYKTKVCYDVDHCRHKLNCSYAHHEHELELKLCKFNKYCKNKDLCQFFHSYVEGYRILGRKSKMKRYYDYDKKRKQKFELMKKDILFDKNVMPFLQEIFYELSKLTPDIEKLIISYFPVFY